MTADATNVQERKDLWPYPKSARAHAQKIELCRKSTERFAGGELLAKFQEAVMGWTFSHDGAYSLGTEGGKWAGDTGHRLWKSCYRDMKPD